jgi:hypothetical protein
LPWILPSYGCISRICDEGGVCEASGWM